MNFKYYETIIIVQLVKLNFVKKVYSLLLLLSHLSCHFVLRQFLPSVWFEIQHYNVMVSYICSKSWVSFKKFTINLKFKAFFLSNMAFMRIMPFPKNLILSW